MKKLQEMREKALNDKDIIMANSEIINLIISTVAEMVIYLMPVTALLAGLIFIFSVLYEFTIGAVRNIR